MTSPAELYVNGIKRKLNNYYAAWLPNEKLKLGDIGVLQGNFFRRITKLEDLGIAFEERPDADSTPIDYVSENGVDILVKASGEINTQIPNIPEAKAGIAVEFSQQGAFIIQAAESYEPTIENIAALERNIINLYIEGKWFSNWAVIVKIVQTPYASIIVSNSSTSKVELSTEGDANIGTFSLGDAKIKFTLRRQNGDVLKAIGAKNLTPFFQLARIRMAWPGPVIFYSHRPDRLFPSVSEGTGLLPPQEYSSNPELQKVLRLDIIRD